MNNVNIFRRLYDIKKTATHRVTVYKTIFYANASTIKKIMNNNANTYITTFTSLRFPWAIFTNG